MSVVRKLDNVNLIKINNLAPILNQWALKSEEINKKNISLMLIKFLMIIKRNYSNVK